MNILQIGAGAVAGALNELFELEHVKIKTLTVVSPEYPPSWMNYNKHIKIALDDKNIDSVLGPLITQDTFVVDVSVDVDCIPIMKLCKDKKAKYINTSLEDWSDDSDLSTFDVNNKSEMRDRVLFYRMNKAKKVLEGAQSSILVDNGQNPGLVTQYVKYALKWLAKEYKDKKSLKFIKNGKFNKASAMMGLQVIHISELDTQRANFKLKPDIFYNTWSCVGFQSEALDPVSIGYGSQENNIKKQWIKTTDSKNSIVRFMDKRGCDVTKKTYCVTHSRDIIQIEGYCIPHGESYTICKELTYKSYRPSVYYLYCCNPPAIDSIDELKERNYKPFEHYKVLGLEELKCGYDSVGVLLFFTGQGTLPKVAHWYGSSMSITNAKKLGFIHSGPTTIQVAISILNAIRLIDSKRTDKKFITPEDLDYNYMIENSKKYLGKMISKTFEYNETIPLTFDKF